ncbi:hypothetical protein T11_8187 [Trichinella zimbabwensis]|uniref:Uncharacterized protein n=1 Tax=Trichinella zimbabwensis TaxID=268475 RepID=A0A0V1GDQ9_9BILA|nr:hypothetical protein T11_8187 [Trichinella zimbabwensis]
MGDLRYISGNSQIKFLIFSQFPNSHILHCLR